MSITQEEIEKIAKNLTKVHLKNPEDIAQSINSILQYIDILNEVDTTNVEPTVSVIEKKYSLYETKKALHSASSEELLACSPQEIVANQIAVNNIMHS